MAISTSTTCSIQPSRSKYIVFNEFLRRWVTHSYSFKLDFPGLLVDLFESQHEEDRCEFVLVENDDLRAFLTCDVLPSGASVLASADIGEADITKASCPHDLCASLFPGEIEGT